MLSYFNFPLRNLAFHWRSSLPVVLGVTLGAAVLAGALIIGDSLKGSLRERGLRQLMGFESAYLGTQLLREDASQGLLDDVPVYPLVLLQGSLRADDTRQLPRVTVYGVPDQLVERFGITATREEFGVHLTSRVAQQLKVSIGDSLVLNVEKSTGLPRSSFLSSRDSDNVSASQKVKVLSIVEASHSANDLNLNPGPQAPLNIFLSLKDVQKLIGKPGRINAMLTNSDNIATLNAQLHQKLTLEDWGLRITTPTKRTGYLSIESEQLVLNPAMVASIEKAATSKNLAHERTTAYLANTLVAGTKPILTRDTADPNTLIPYSVVVGLNPQAQEPLGPFLPVGQPLQDDEILLADWPDSPLKMLKPGDRVTMAFFKPEMEASLDETSFTFKLRGFVPLSGAALDPNLTPPFPGITDKLRISEWNSPFELNRTRLKSNDRNEKYWEQYKTTPKAYITLAKGEQLFGSRFGSVTSVRVASTDAKGLDSAIRQNLDPAGSGIQFSNLKERVLSASQGGTDFAAMFLAFSWLLIFTGLLLVGLLFRLSMDRRAKEIGVMLATGYSPKQVQRLLVREGLLLTLVGSVFGIALAIGYARLMLGVLITLWPDQGVGDYLKIHVQVATPIIALVLTIVFTRIAIWFSLRNLFKITPPALLRGETRLPEGLDGPARKSIASLVLAGMLLLMAVGSLAAGTVARTPDERSGAFFGGGGLLMLGGLLVARYSLKRQPNTLSQSVFALGLRNAGRNPVRSLLSAALIAVASFLVISVESFRRSPDQDFASVSGGSGGYSLLAEADVPLFNSFGKQAGLDDFQKNLQKIYQDQGGDAEEKSEAAAASLKGLEVQPILVQGGDDASCLNLYQAGKPRVLGLPESLRNRKGFRFTQTLANTAEEKANPWLLLTDPKPGEPVPFIAEQNSAMFMLKMGLGGVLEIPDENGKLTKFKLVAMIQDSVFQSELLISDAAFHKLFPRQEGYRLFLIDPKDVASDKTVSLLQLGFRNHGLTVSRSADRVAQYQAVVGAYLTTFQLLGGFALLLAILGLGIVILRSVWERGSELALLRAVGYTPTNLQKLVLAETLLILGIGLGLGLGTALLSVLPGVVLGATLPIKQLLALGLAIGVVALGVTGLATRNVARIPIITALRRD